MINGKCCAKIIKREIYTKMCDPCDKLDYLDIQRSINNGNVTFSPNIVHNSYFIYNWDFNAGPAPLNI